MQVIELSTDFASIRTVARDSSTNREWLYRHTLHELVKAYRREFGAVMSGQMLDELTQYHELGKEVFNREA